MWRALALLSFGLSASACGNDTTPPDTSDGYSLQTLVSVFERECVEEEFSLARQAAETMRGSGCLGDDDCEREARGSYGWRPRDAPESRVSMMSDGYMLSSVRGDGWHCDMRFWRRPDDQTLTRLSQLAARQGLSRYDTWEQDTGGGHIVWHVWRPEGEEIPELRLIQQERPMPWTLLYVE
jgi:hypothetical protein